MAAITSANCAYMRPVSPGRNAAGRNTDISTSVMPTIGPNSARIASLAAWRPGMPFLDIVDGALHHHDGIVHHDANRQHDREQGREIDGESERRHGGEGADDGHRHRGCRYQHRAPVLQEQENDDENEDRGLVQGLVHLVDGLFDEPRGVERDAGDQPWGNSRASTAILPRTSFATLSAFAPGAWKIARPAAGLPSSVNTWP